MDYSTMQVTETRTEGLQREFRVVVPAADLEAKVNARLSELKDRVQLRGFRPGKVPVAHLKRVYGRGAMAEVIEAAVNEANVKIITDHGFKLATDPKVTMPSEQGEVEGVFGGKSDLSYTVAIEIVPPIQLADFKNLKLQRLSTDVTDAEVEDALNRIAQQNLPVVPKEEGADAADATEIPAKVAIDDAFAASLGMESLAKLKDAVSNSLAREHAATSRRRLKRELLDQLDASHKFDPPPTLVEQEFDQVWKSILSELNAQGRTFADEGTTEEAAKADYRVIAARRVRLGLVLSEIGDKNSIKVSDEEITAAVAEQARQFPGKEQQVWEYYRSNPGALAGLRAPIYEEKVVDFLIELANVTDKKVSREELYKDEGETAQPEAGDQDIPVPA